ncbi:MAG: HEAT repeat domain-containing protein [Myxococcota bacterium]|nr:HEAT repeat domain-containing protein [Myxococcota bacterium]
MKKSRRPVPWVLIGVAIAGIAAPPGSAFAEAAPASESPEKSPVAETSTSSEAQLLDAENPKLRAKGIQTVVQHKNIGALPKLISMAKEDQVAGIRRLACWAIGEMGLTDGVQTLQTVAQKDAAPGVRLAAQRALEKLGVDEETPQPDPLAAPSEAGKEGAGKPLIACAKDTDCKGDRICVEGSCQDLKKYPVLGWAMEASIIGFVGTAAVGGLSVYAAMKPEDLLPAIPLAAGATLVTVIVAPAIKSGSLSVREPSDVPGSLTLRVIGWASFGVHLAGSAALAAAIPFYWLKKDEAGDPWTPQTSWIIANSIVGMVSLLTLSVEALVARSQAKRRLREMQRHKKEEAQLSIAPYLTPALQNGAANGITAGITGRF